MAQDTLIKGEVLQVSGSISTDQGHITSDGANGTLTTVASNITTGTITTANITNPIVGGINGGSAGASVTTSGTISTSKLISKVVTGSAVTAVIMASGTTDGQICYVEHVGAAASSITFATAGSAAGSSHLATDFVFSGQKAGGYIWESTTALWYPLSY